MKKTHFFFRVLTLFFAFSSSIVNSQTDPNDVAAMQSISKGLNGATSLGWTDPDPCNWAHVYCFNNRVTTIQIGNLKLQGNLSPLVRNLTGLLRLELMTNEITGDLPSLKDMSSLQFLLLHSNKFQSIPVDFFDGLTGLLTVDIDDNPFSSWELPDTLKNSVGLVNLSAVNTNLTGKIPDYFGDGFPSINHLSLSYNWLTGGLPASFSGSSIQSLWLNNQNGVKLSGSIDVVQNMSNLNQLWLHSNSFSGPLPDFSMLESLYDLKLRDNQFTGPVPQSLITLPALKNVSLTNNLLQGPLPVFSKSVTADVVGTSNSFCVPTGGHCDPRVNDLLLILEPLNYPVKLANDWKGNNPCAWTGITCNGNGNITVVNFIHLGVNGTISPAFSRLLSLQKLLLANNFLTGEIPAELTSLKDLIELNVSYNLLKGQVPAFDPKVKVITTGNVGIGRNDTSPVGGAPSSSPTNSTNSPTGSGITDGSSGKKSSLSVGTIVGAVIGGVCVVFLVGLLGFCFYKRRQQPFGRVQSPNTTVIHPRHSGSDPEMVKITVAGANLAGGTASETYSRGSSGPSDVQVVETGNMVISIQVLRNVTNNFSEENILGSGGFGTVYKGELHDGTKIAVKRMESGVIGGKGLNEFTSEIAVLTKVRHRHLVALLGYCLDGNERLLVYEYMPQGTLSRFLFNWKEEGLKPLEWMKRLSIALDVARGVEYLHSLAHQSFIHRDLKPSNILLGDDMRAKVADFGLVRLAPDGGKCSVETRLAGTFGYLAPEYAVTGRVTTKVDVFSFGVILMELLTGRKALDETQPEESVHLVTWFRRMQINKDTFRKAIDPTIDLDDEETVSTVNTVADLAGHCCAREPYQRPDMGHAVNVLSSLVELWKPSDPDSEDIYGIDLDMTLPQALKKWQAFEDTGATSSFLVSMDNTQTSIPTRPSGFADSFTSADGR